MTDTIERTKPSDLYGTCIDVLSVDYDWSEGYGEKWEPLEAIDYTTSLGTVVTLICNGMSVISVYLEDGTRIDSREQDEYFEAFDPDDVEGTGEPAITEDELAECFDSEPDSADGPMMNYYYPLNESIGYGGNGNVFGPYSSRYDEIEAAYRIRNHPLCLIRFEDDGSYALALTGGGMDLTWSIVGAYVDMGYLPPAAFCRPPGFRTHDEGYLVACMAETLRLIVQRHQHSLDRLLAEYPNAVTQTQTDDEGSTE